MNDQQQQIVEKLKGANNILVTVSANPSVDQLAACIGLTLLLNKLKKHATAVFSGDIPSTIEFLKPEETIEKNTDSLRDFIIALDKSKADKLRYKVEDRVVKIFITPYRTSITQNDLDFSQGDFNVDVVVALGVHEQTDLDQAITAHGRILHDAVVTSINTSSNSELGTVNWTNTQASSLSELVAEIADVLGKDLLDAQTSTALLTGIVAETNRFSNEKTSPETMRLAAELMASGANQQLVASELQQGTSQPVAPAQGAPAPTQGDNGTLEIEHAKAPDLSPNPSLPPVDENPPAAEPPQPELPKIGPVHAAPPSELGTPKRMTEPPSLGGQLTANTQPEGLDPAIDPLSLPKVEPSSEPLILNRDAPPADEPLKDTNVNPAPPTPAEPIEPEGPPQIHIDADGNLQIPHTGSADTPASTPPPSDNKDKETLSDIEEAVGSPHIADEDKPEASDVDSARSAVMDAIKSSPDSEPLHPIAALNAQPLGQDLHDDTSTQPPAGPPPSEPTPTPLVPPIGSEPAPGLSPADQPMDMPLPPTLTPPPANPTPPTSSPNDPSAPPPVPPPIPPDYLNRN